MTSEDRAMRAFDRRSGADRRTLAIGGRRATDSQEDQGFEEWMRSITLEVWWEIEDPIEEALARAGVTTEEAQHGSSH